VQLRNSPQKFSSLPARIVTIVPSMTSPNAKTLKAIGSVLFERQCVGSVVQTCENTTQKPLKAGDLLEISWRSNQMLRDY
ncbi:hypothetical protein DOY81_006979, partial [Sarcophaga bullata]